MAKGFKGFIKTPVGDYVVNFLLMALFVTIGLGLYDLYLDKPFDFLAYLFRFITFGLLGILIRRIEKSAEAKSEKRKLDNSNQ